MKKILVALFCVYSMPRAANAVSCVLSTNNALTSAQVILQSNNSQEYQNCASIGFTSVPAVTPTWYVYSCATCKSGTQQIGAEGRIPSNQQLIKCTVCGECSNSGSCEAAAEVCSDTTGVCRTAQKNTNTSQCSDYCPSKSATYDCAPGWYRTENWNSVPDGTKYCLAEGKGGTNYNCDSSTGDDYSICRKCTQFTNNNNATSDKGDNTAITKCYLPVKTDCSDSFGKCELASKCYYAS